MSNIKSLSDLKKDSGQRGNQGPPGGPGFPGLGAPPSTPDSKRIKHVHDGQLRQELSSAGSKLVVIDFTASWCGPCQMIKPYFSEYAEKYTNAVFLKIDVDESPNTARECGVKAMPTFQFFKNSKKLDELTGADPNKLKTLIEKHYSASTESTASESGFSGGGYVLGSKTSSTNPSTAPTTSNSDVNEVFLAGLVDMGFDRNKCIQALKSTNSAGLEAAMDWILSHPDPEPMVQSVTHANNTPTTTINENNNKSADAPTPMETESTPKEVSPGLATTTSDKPPTVHNALCNKCEDQIVGIRYHCKTCRDYDLCPECYANRTHDPQHEFDAFTEDIVIEKRPLTKEELEAEKKKLQEKIKQVRASKTQQEVQSDVEREKVRRESGKDALEAKRLHEERTRQREAAIRKKEQEEERAAKEKIKAKLEQDKRERAAKKEAMQSAETQPAKSGNTPVPTTTQYTDAMIQFRLPDGNTIKATFKATDPVRTVHNHVALLLGTQNFSLSTNFPKRVYSPRDSIMDTTTLSTAEQVPSGTFIVTKL